MRASADSRHRVDDVLPVTEGEIRDLYQEASVPTVKDRNGTDLDPREPTLIALEQYKSRQHRLSK